MPGLRCAVIPLVALLATGCASAAGTAAGDPPPPAGEPALPTLPAVMDADSYQALCEALMSAPRGGDEAARLHRLFEGHWAWTMAEHPGWATYVGHPAPNDRWTDRSAQARQRREALDALTLDVLTTFDRGVLSPGDQLNFDLFEREARDQVEGARFPSDLLPMSQMGGVQQDVPSTLASMPAFNRADLDHILSRLKRIPAFVAQTQALMEEGLSKGLTPPKIILRDVPDQIRALLGSDLSQSPLLVAFTELPPDVDAAEGEALMAEARRVVAEEVQPAYAALLTFMEERYIPAARDTIAITALPDGDAWYAWAVRHHTTTDLTPQQIHEIGLNEVARIRQEMEAVIAEVGFDGSFADFTAFLRTDPRFFYTDADALLAGYRDICKRADPHLIEQFGHLPRLPYGVKAIPDYAARSQTTAYYHQGSLTAGRPGWFFANTWDLASRPRWEMEALTLHEAVPGHHLQISIAQELEDLPTFRRQMGISAFIEGWGLYAESLGYEMGFYEDPYSRFGQLTYEMWRAVRLVVDTGMHSMGWSREQAIAFFAANSSKAEHDIVVEIDRYISWPGQALAYKVGQLKIMEIRQRAEQALGDRFDVRAFHDALLEGGALPLDILDARMNTWINDQRSR